MEIKSINYFSFFNLLAQVNTSSLYPDHTSGAAVRSFNSSSGLHANLDTQGIHRGGMHHTDTHLIKTAMPFPAVNIAQNDLSFYPSQTMLHILLSAAYRFCPTVTITTTCLLIPILFPLLR